VTFVSFEALSFFSLRNKNRKSVGCFNRREYPTI